MGAKYWIKLHHEMLHDRKMAQLRDRLWRRAVECFLFAGELDEDGYLPTVADMAWSLHADLEQLETELQELAQAGILQMIDGRWHVTNFVVRQSKMSKAEYMRRLRAEQRKESYYPDDDKSLPERYRRVTNGNTDKIREEKKREEREDIFLENPIHSGTHYELPPSSLPNYEHVEKRNDMITALSKVVRETYAIGVNSDRFEQIADALIADDVTEEQVAAFPNWWEGLAKRPYDGKPYLKSLLNNISNVKSPALKRSWIDDAKTFEHPST